MQPRTMSGEKKEQEWIAPRQAQSLLGVSRATLARLAKSNRVRARVDTADGHRTWLYDLQDVLRAQHDGSALRQHHSPRKVLSLKQLWESHFGPVPYACIVTARDGNSENRAPTNLCLLPHPSRAKMPRRKSRKRAARWTPELRKQLRRRFPVSRTKDLEAEIGFSVSVIQREAKRLGLTKKANHLSEVSRARRSLPIGTERVKEADFVWVKVTEHGAFRQQWRPKHHVIWEQANGQPVPKRYRVIFRDGNKRNFALDNLQLMPLEEVSARAFANFYAYPEPLQRAALALGKLKRRVRQELSGAPREVNSRPNQAPKSPPRRWTAEMDSVLRAKYPTEPLEDVAAEVGTTVSSVLNRAKRLRVRRSAEAMITHARKSAARNYPLPERLQSS